MARPSVILKPAVLLTVVRVGFKAIFTRAVPWYVKALLIFAIFYAIFPFDIFPEALIPLVGYLDDVAIVTAIFTLALSLTPQDALKDNPMKAGEPTDGAKPGATQETTVDTTAPAQLPPGPRR